MVDQQVAVQVMRVSRRMDVREDGFWMHEDARVAVEREDDCRAPSEFGLDRSRSLSEAHT